MKFSPRMQAGVLSKMRGAGVVFGSGLLLASCMANPGPAPIAEPEPEEEAVATSTTSTTKEVSRRDRQLNIGIDPVAAGLNPHLVSQDSTFVSALADLVFPSAFHNGELNTDLLTSAEETTLAENTTAMTVRYQIAPEAQWSDGTPITVEDFRYLHQQIMNTPGAKDTALYRTIAQIRSSNGGKTVEVDFTQPVQNWTGLFQHLMPSHVLAKDPSGFNGDLRASIPASGWRYSFASFDRSRGLITLHRNDRFWGKDPASFEQLNFYEIRSQNQATELLRTGQLHFLDISPTPTAELAFPLIDGTQQRTYSSARTLQMVLNTHLEREQREAIAKIIDPSLTAAIAYGRTNDLDVSSASPVTEGAAVDEYGDEYAVDSAELQELFPKTIRIGVDPNDSVAQQATKVIIDQLAAQGIQAQEVGTDSLRLYGEYFEHGANLTLFEQAAEPVDAIVVVDDTDVLSQYQCVDSQQTDAEETTSAPAEATTSAPAEATKARTAEKSSAATQKSVLGTNFSGWCNTATDHEIAEVLSGARSYEDFLQIARNINALGVYHIPIASEVRLQVRSDLINSPEPETQPWPTSLSTLNDWNVREQ